MRAVVAKRLNRIASLTGIAPKRLKRGWGNMPRARLRPGRRRFVRREGAETVTVRFDRQRIRSTAALDVILAELRAKAASPAAAKADA